MSHPTPPNHPAATPPSGTIISRDLEQKVARLVVDALLRCGLDPGQCEVAPAETKSPETSNPTSTPLVPSSNEGVADALTIETNVISVDLLNSLSIGDREILVSRNAVVTPAAKDWLREKKIQWSRQVTQAAGLQASGASAKADVSSSNLVATSWVYDSENHEHAIGFTKQLGMRGLTTTPLQTPPTTTESLGAGIILSSLPAVDVDTWGRERGFRVASIDSPTQINAIATAIAPQIWILDKSRVPFHGRVSLAALCIRTAGAQTTGIQTTSDRTTNASPRGNGVTR